MSHPLPGRRHRYFMRPSTHPSLPRRTSPSLAKKGLEARPIYCIRADPLYSGRSASNLLVVPASYPSLTTPANYTSPAVLAIVLPPPGHVSTPFRYNSSASSVKMVYEKFPVPQEVPGRWCYVSCGQTHCLAIDKAEGEAYAWGEGSYGRLGNGKHSNDDQLTPQPLSKEAGMGRFQQRCARVYAGKTFNLLTLSGGMVFTWGRMRGASPVKSTPEYDEAYNGGGRLGSVGFTNDGTVFVVGNDACCVGTGAYRQLAFSREKSSAPTPAYCALLEGVHVEQVACGLEASLFLVERTPAGKKVGGRAL